MYVCKEYGCLESLYLHVLVHRQICPTCFKRAVCYSVLLASLRTLYFLQNIFSLPLTNFFFIVL